MIYDTDERMLRRTADLIKAQMEKRGEPCGLTQCKDEKSLRRVMQQPDFFPDILVIDAHLEKDGGLELVGELKKRYDSQVIFTSDYPETVFAAYSVTHTWFVRKSELEEELKRALEKASENLRLTIPQKIALRASHRRIVVNKMDIVYAEQSLRRLRLVCRDGSEHVVYSKMDDMLQALNADYFVRCHKSYFVNAGAVREYTYSRILLQSGREIPISKTYARSVSEQLDNWYGARATVCV